MFVLTKTHLDAMTEHGAVASPRRQADDLLHQSLTCREEQKTIT